MSYIKLERKMLDWEWFSDPSTAHLWVYLLLKANFKRNSWRGVVVDEGCLITSESTLVAETGLSRQQIRTALKKLISTNEITKVSTREYTLIKVNKWALYQVSNQDDNQPPTSVATNEPPHQSTNGATILKEYKEVKNTRNIYYRPSIEEVEAYCRERHNGVDPQKWFDFYTANGWKVGRNSMKDWKASVRYWERNNPKPTVVSTEETVPTYSTEKNKGMSSEEEKELLRLMGK